jgi:hypothetical protein
VILPFFLPLSIGTQIDLQLCHDRIAFVLGNLRRQSPNCSPMAVWARSKNWVVPVAHATDMYGATAFEKLTADVDRLLQDETGFMVLVSPELTSPLIKMEDCL